MHGGSACGLDLLCGGHLQLDAVLVELAVVLLELLLGAQSVLQLRPHVVELHLRRLQRALLAAAEEGRGTAPLALLGRVGEDSRADRLRLRRL